MGVQAQPQKFWFVKNPGKISNNSRKIPQSLGTDVSKPIFLLYDEWDWLSKYVRMWLFLFQNTHGFCVASKKNVLIIFESEIFRVSLSKFWQKYFALPIGLPDAFCKNTGHFDLSTLPDLNRVVFRKRRRENREAISIVKPQLPVFWLAHYISSVYVCACDVTIASKIASSAINFGERTVLTRFTTRVNIIWEILR